jgi:glycosyltransferase involved in cell wall biosynthesis
MIKITYLIPIDALGGGVEVAAKNFKEFSNKKFSFKVKYIFKRKKELNNLWLLLKCSREIILNKPDVLLISLWRAQLVGIFVKFFSPKTKLIFFIHSEADVHFLDFLSARLALILSSEVWADSYTSLNERFKNSKKIKKGRIISFDSREIQKINITKVKPNFIFWGRIGKEKGLDRALAIFSKVLKFYPKAIFTIIGSDGGDLQSSKKKCNELKIENSVIFYDEMEFSEIKKHAQNSCFYLQTSLYEGAAMSVMESMKLGLVPIVTTVGEVSRYCKSTNSIIVYSNCEAARDIIIVLESNDHFYKLSDNAYKQWENTISYKESMLKACNEMVLQQF